MKLLFLITTALFVLHEGCSSWRKTMIAQGDKNTAVQNAIQDFLHSCRISKGDSIFSVNIKNVNEGILGVSILGTNNKLLPNAEDKIGTNHPHFPTRYSIQEGKLFYWYDSTYNISEELISALVRFNHIDSINVDGFKAIPETSSHIDDSKKGVDYYFCIRNLKKYKRVVTKTAMGWYEVPKINCK